MVTLSSAAIWYGLPSYMRSAKAYSAGLISSIASASLFEFAAAAAVAGVVAVLPVDEFVDEGAAFARVGDAPVDEHGVGGEAVDAVQFAGQAGAGHVQVGRDLVEGHAYLPVAHARRYRERIRHAGSSPSPSNLWSSS